MACNCDRAERLLVTATQIGHKLGLGREGEETCHHCSDGDGARCTMRGSDFSVAGSNPLDKKVDDCISARDLIASESGYENQRVDGIITTSADMSSTAWRHGQSEYGTARYATPYWPISARVTERCSK